MQHCRITAIERGVKNYLTERFEYSAIYKHVHLTLRFNAFASIGNLQSARSVHFFGTLIDRSNRIRKSLPEFFRFYDDIFIEKEKVEFHFTQSISQLTVLYPVAKVSRKIPLKE